MSDWILVVTAIAAIAIAGGTWWFYAMTDLTQIRLETDCPKCGRPLEEYFDFQDSDQPLNKPSQDRPYYVSSGSTYSHPDYGAVHEWTVEAKCPECKTEWSFSDGSA